MFTHNVCPKNSWIRNCKKRSESDDAPFPGGGSSVGSMRVPHQATNRRSAHSAANPLIPHSFVKKLQPFSCSLCHPPFCGFWAFLAKNPKKRQKPKFQKCAFESRILVLKKSSAHPLERPPDGSMEVQPKEGVSGVVRLSPSRRRCQAMASAGGHPHGKRCPSPEAETRDRVV